MDPEEKVYPTEDELSKVTTNLNCPECPSVFHSESNLNLHLAKTHKKPHLLQSAPAPKIYHCPVASCSYHSACHFKQYKFLKQHYLKVHSEKKYMCSLCSKGFATEAFKNRHAEYCNIVFKCCDCDMFYACYETLKTHGRRKKHKIFEKIAYKAGPQISSPKSEALLSSRKERLLLPKASLSEGNIEMDTLEKSIQTEVRQRALSTQETQTLVYKRPRLTVETQTIGDYITRRPEASSTKTQTIIVKPKTVACNTFTLMRPDLNCESGTQTAIFNPPGDFISSSSTSTHDSIKIDTADLFSDTLDSNFFNCHMETQTDLNLSEDLFRYCDDSTNMWTQTCDDLLGEIGLNNIHTQTVFDDILKSVESQTTMSLSRKVLPLSCKDMSHMETQTDVEFKQMLEEINA